MNHKDHQEHKERKEAEDLKARQAGADFFVFLVCFVVQRIAA